MHKVDIMYDLELDYLFDERHEENKVNRNKDKGKHVKVSEKTFDLMIREGLIKKTDDGYVFVGKYEDAFKKKNKKNKIR